jgi:uracil-DNA glycosylase
MPTKESQLLALARARQKCEWAGCRYKRIGDYCDGKYECNFVSPYTRSACNVDADLMVLLQDWASDEVLSGDFLESRCTLGHDPKRWTNKHLKNLLEKHFKVRFEDIYATNVFPLVKLGSMSASIKPSDLIRAATEFALPQIGIIAPRLAICLGKAAFNAVAVAAGMPKAKTLDNAIESPFLAGKTKVWCQAHTGQQSRNFRNRGGVDRVSKDWARMAAAYKTLVD